MKSQAEGDKKRKKEKRVSWRSAQVVGISADGRIVDRIQQNEMTENYQEKRGEQDQGLTQTRFKPIFPTCAPYLVSEVCVAMPRLQESSGHLNRIVSQFSAILVALCSRFLLIE